MRGRGFWRGEIDRLNREAIGRLEVAARRELARFRIEFLALQDRAAYGIAVQRHGARLAVILGVHGRLTANAFALLTARMIGLPSPLEKSMQISNKATPEEATSKARLGEVLTALARTIVSGALVDVVAGELGRSEPLVATVNAAILSAPSGASATDIAANLLEDRNVSARLAQAAAAAMSAPDTPPGSETPASGAGSPSAGQSGGGRPPSNLPPTGGGGPRPKRSRFSELVERIVREEAPARARRIAATSGRVIADVLARAAAEGWGEEKTARALEQALGDEVAAYRARRIARTEMGGGQNGATFAIALDRAEAGEELDKTWITIMDGRERQSHHDLNRETRPLTERFSNGLMHPHEFSAPLAEIVNCRCGMMIFRRSSKPAQSDAPADGGN